MVNETLNYNENSVDDIYLKISEIVFEIADEISDNVLNSINTRFAFQSSLIFFSFKDFIEKQCKNKEKTFIINNNLPGIDKENIAVKELFLLNYINIGNNFIHLINLDSESKEFASIPAYISESYFAPDFYLFTFLDIENKTCILKGFLSHQQISKRALKSNLESEYIVPLDNLNKPEELFNELIEKEEKEFVNYHQEYKDEVEKFFSLSNENIIENFISFPELLPREIYLSLLSNEKLSLKYIELQNKLKSFDYSNKISNISDKLQLRAKRLAIISMLKEKDYKSYNFEYGGDAEEDDKLIVFQEENNIFNFVGDNFYCYAETNNKDKVIKIQSKGLKDFQLKKFLVLIDFKNNGLDYEKAKNIFNKFSNKFVEDDEFEKEISELYFAYSAENTINDTGELIFSEKYNGEINLPDTKIVYIGILEDSDK